MTRLLLALCLALCASAALADATAPAAADAPVCLKPEAKADEATEGAKAAGVAPAGTATPAKARSAGRSTPRWPSLLPGMFR